MYAARGVLSPIGRSKARDRHSDTRCAALRAGFRRGAGLGARQIVEIGDQIGMVGTPPAAAAFDAASVADWVRDRFWK